MKNIFILFFSLNSLAQVIDTQKYLHPSLSEGQCYSLADSKVYLKDVKSGRSNPELEAALGKENLTSMNNTDKESYFFCKMKCLINSETKFLWNIQKDKNENFKNMNGFVCLGLEITNVQATPTLSIMTTVAHPIETVNSQSESIRNFLKEINYKIPSFKSDQYLNSFFQAANQISESYKSANLPVFRDAGSVIKSFNLADFQNKESYLNQKVQILIKNHWKKEVSLKDYLNKENLIDIFLIQNAKFIEFLN